MLKRGGSGSEDGEAAFEQWKSGVKKASFYPWQMQHFRFGDDTGKAYVTPHLSSITKVWTGYRIMRNQIFSTKAEMGLTIRVHKVPVPYNAGVNDVRRLISQYREGFGVQKTFSVTSANQLKGMTRGKVPNDVFIPVRYTPDGKVISAEIDIKPQVGDIFDQDEMIYWANHLFTRLRVPPKLLFWDTSRQKIAESGTDPENVQLVKFAKTLANAIVSGIRNIIDIELFLNGVMPSDESYKVSVPSSHTTSDLSRARAAALIGQSLIMSQKAGIPVDWWLHYIIGMDEDTVASLEVVDPESIDQEEMAALNQVFGAIDEFNNNI